MSTITKEQIEQYANAARLIQVSEFDKGKLITVTPDHLLELARIALASLEAEAVGITDSSEIECLKRGEMANVMPPDYKGVDAGDEVFVYIAPPAPANAEPVAWLWSHRKHPSEVTLVRPEDDERADGAHWSGWSCQALYAAPPAPVSVPEWTNEQCLEFLSIAFRHAEINGDLELDDIRLGVKMVNGSRATMLQGGKS
ncbi:TPA: hypothetical protein I3321_002415 [Enterobacter roggenkampii]|nr:hypothetical protein [Enterobacter roggenkampii]